MLLKVLNVWLPVYAACNRDLCLAAVVCGWLEVGGWLLRALEAASCMWLRSHSRDLEHVCGGALGGC